MGPGFEIDQDELAAAGDKFIEFADDAAAALARVVGSIEGHDESISGFQATGRVDELAAQWRTQIEELCGRLAAVGSVLKENKDNYQNIEDAIEGTLQTPAPEMTPSVDSGA